MLEEYFSLQFMVLPRAPIYGRGEWGQLGQQAPWDTDLTEKTVSPGSPIFVV